MDETENPGNLNIGGFSMPILAMEESAQPNAEIAKIESPEAVEAPTEEQVKSTEAVAESSNSQPVDATQAESGHEMKSIEPDAIQEKPEIKVAGFSTEPQIGTVSRNQPVFSTQEGNPKSHAVDALTPNRQSVERLSSK